MSVTMSLYRIIPNVTYVPTILDAHKRCDYDDKDGTIDWLRLPVWAKEAEYGAPLPTEEAIDPTNHKAYCAWCDEYDKWLTTISSWSDGGHYERFNLFGWKEDMNYKEFLALKEKYKPTINNNGFGYVEMNLPVEEVEYFQGWYFKRRFLNKKSTVFITTSKEKMIKFLYSNLKYKNNDDVKESIQRFINSWTEETMIFECAW